MNDWMISERLAGWDVDTLKVLSSNLPRANEKSMNVSSQTVSLRAVSTGGCVPIWKSWWGQKSNWTIMYGKIATCLKSTQNQA